MDEQKTLVSIIVRTKDRPKLLKRAIQSVANQTYRPIEVVLVNDGGCDLDADELKTILGDVSLNCIRLEKNMGRAHAGNVGIAEASGDYIGFLDDDDVLYPEHVAELIAAHVGKDYKVVYSDTEIVHLSYDPGKDMFEEIEITPRESLDFSFATLLVQNYISFMSLLFYRSVLLDVGGFDEEFDLCEDWDLLIRLGKKCPFHHVRKITAKYSFWSKESQVTIGDDKLAPFRLKILSKYSGEITPEVIYRLVYEGKFLGLAILQEKINVLENKIGAFEDEISRMQAEKEHLQETLTRIRNSRCYKVWRFLRREKKESIWNPPRCGDNGSALPPLAKKAPEMVSYPSVSVILRVKNEGRTIERVIRGIRGQDYPGDVEIVVVDSGSTDNTLEVARKYGCKIVPIDSGGFTFGKALNIGYREAWGEIFVNLSGHTVPVNSQFLRSLISPYEDPLVAATFGRNVPLPEACPSEARDLETWYPDEWLDVPDRFSNGNASLRRTAWEKIPFNEEVTGSEDIIWAKQILDLGFQIVYVPSAAAYHSHSSSLKYAFVRRFRETKALAENGQFYTMSLLSFLKWTADQTRSDIRYARGKQYGFKWYAHIPFYRAFQGAAIYAVDRDKEHNRKVMAEKVASLKERVSGRYQKFLGYYQKSRRVIKAEGWQSFFSKARGKILRAANAAKTSMGTQESGVARAPGFPSPRKFRVLFIVDPLGSLTNHYRAHAIGECLSVSHIEHEIVPETELNYDRAATFDIVVLCRVFMNPHIEKLIELCRRLKIPVLFDADDLVIDPSIVDHIASLEGISEYEKSLHVEGLRKHRESFDHADFFTAPTHFLSDVGRRLHKPSFVIRNGVSFSQIEVSRKILDVKAPSSEPKLVTIGYFSGTKTHQKDFSLAVPALVRIMEDFPHVHLCIGGHLDIDRALERFDGRVKRLPFVPFQRLQYNIAKVDVNIAPLVVNNAFCEAKSELKYFDAGLLNIPTVASPTDAFRWAIESGVNGFLAASAEEWYESLRRLVEDAELRKTMGQKAYEHVMRHYTPDSMAYPVKKTYEEIIWEYRNAKGIAENALKISFIVPPPIKGSGGHNKIFTAAGFLMEFGHHVCLYFVNDGSFGGQQHLEEFISSHFFDPGCEIVLGTDTILSCDVLCSTSWVTAYAVHQQRSRAAAQCYFVQDFEPLFFPMSDEYLKAENTYRLGLHHISFGPWCAKILRERYHARADFIPFSIDRNVYYPRDTEQRNARSVLFFARPEMPRRCFALGIEALTIFSRRNPDVEILLFGSRQMNSSMIPFPHQNLGILLPGELAMRYSRAGIGLAFSTTNPSMVPFEMMACGCPVIDLDYNDNYINYGSRENVKLVGISPEEIATGIEEMIRDDDLRSRIAENGFRFVRDFPDDRETFKAMEAIFLEAFGIRKSPVPPKPIMAELSPLP